MKPTTSFVVFWMAIFFLLFHGSAFIGSSVLAETWTRHTIDSSSRGADGVRLGDCNGDGRLDITTGWEEGGITRVYFHPGPKHVGKPWPAVTLGKTESVEDAFFVDLDSDGRPDVVSCCEGNRQAVLVHWNDAKNESPSMAWTQAEFPVCSNKTRWMYATDLDVNRDGRVDLVLGAKNPHGRVSALISPTRAEDARDLGKWQLQHFVDAGWIMSLVSIDLDQDGDKDVLVSDRYGTTSGVFWLENVERSDRELRWPRHEIGLTGEQNVMFLSTYHSTASNGLQIVAAVKPNHCAIFSQDQDPTKPWKRIRDLTYPLETFGTIKCALIGNVDSGMIHGAPNGAMNDVVISCESAVGEKSGLFAIRNIESGSQEFIDIAGPLGTKFDHMELIDLDEDGDTDVLTCEERENLGVVWYENPSNQQTDEIVK